MFKLVFILLLSLFLISCGNQSVEQSVEQSNNVITPIPDEPVFSVEEVEAIFEDYFNDKKTSYRRIVMNDEGRVKNIVNEEVSCSRYRSQINPRFTYIGDNKWKIVSESLSWTLFEKSQTVKSHNIGIQVNAC